MHVAIIVCYDHHDNVISATYKRWRDNIAATLNEFPSV